MNKLKKQIRNYMMLCMGDLGKNKYFFIYFFLFKLNSI